MGRFQNPLEVYELQKMMDEGLEVKEISLRDILMESLLTLKKIELHLQILSGEEIKNHDIGG